MRFVDVNEPPSKMLGKNLKGKSDRSGSPLSASQRDHPIGDSGKLSGLPGGERAHGEVNVTTEKSDVPEV